MHVKNWARFQHYRDRKPPWIKLHRDLLDDFEFHCLQDASKALLPLIWLLASESENGSVPPTKEIAYRLRKTVQQIEQALKPLIDKGFIIEPASDSTALAPRKRLAMPEVEAEIEEEKETDICVRKNPTLEQVSAYCKERQNQVDPAKWFDFYQSKGWYVGKNKMRDWRAAVRTWERNNYGGEFRDGYQKSGGSERQQPGTQERRQFNNAEAIFRAVVGGSDSPDSPRQAARPDRGSHPALEGEIEEMER